MKVFRFDPDIAMTLGNSSSGTKIGQLLGRATLEQASVIFFGHDARYSSPESDARQLFALTSGSCTIESRDLAPFVLRAHQAIVVEPHQRWSASTTEAGVALLLEGSFDVWAVAVTKDIVVNPYDEAWPGSFDQICQMLKPYVDDVALRIDHVGSTAVPGLAAKPVIDIDIVLSGEGEVATVIDRLTAAGYRWRGDLGVTGREAFSPPEESDLPEHHLYAVVENNRAHLDHLLLRDLLRTDPQARDEYAALKTSNVETASGNMDVYVAAKASFVARLLTRARSEQGMAPVEYWTP